MFGLLFGAFIFIKKKFAKQRYLLLEKFWDTYFCLKLLYCHFSVYLDNSVECFNYKGVYDEKSEKLVRKSKREANAIYCILAITSNLIICWLLVILTWPIYKTCKNCLPYLFYTFAYLLNFSFAATNPILLLVFNQNYRSILFRKFKMNGTTEQSKQNKSYKKPTKFKSAASGST